MRYFFLVLFEKSTLTRFWNFTLKRCRYNKILIKMGTVFFLRFSVRLVGKSTVRNSEREHKPIRRLRPVSKREWPKLRHPRTILSDVHGNDVTAERRPEIKIHFRSDAFTFRVSKPTGRRKYNLSISFSLFNSIRERFRIQSD